MGKIQKIACVCPAGLGSSLILGMKVETALSNLGRSDIKVSHTSMGEVTRGSADLFIASSDISDQVAQYGPTVTVVHIVNEAEVEGALKAFFDAHPEA